MSAFDFVNPLGQSTIGGGGPGGDPLDFVREITGRGLVSPSKYYAYIGFPSKMGNAGSKFYPLAESISLPGRGIATLDRKIWGPMIDMPYERIFPGEIELTFMLPVDEVHEHRTIFSQWMDKIVSPEDGSIEPNRASYSGWIDVYLTDNTESRDLLSLRFNEVFPKGINPLPLSYQTVNDYVRQTISFSFRDYFEASEKGNSGTLGTGEVN